MTAFVHDDPPFAAGERGFTLIELMIVVAIIASIAAIVIPNYVHARAQAAVSQTEANIKQIATALELYNGDKQTYPASGTVGPALFGGPGNPYMATTPTNALGRGLYAYALVAASGGTPASYVITDAGPYDPTTLTSLPDGPGGGTLCTACTQVLYDPQNGIYGK